MTDIAFDDIITPYTRQFLVGETYEWPGIPYTTATRGCLRATLLGDGETIPISDLTPDFGMSLRPCGAVKWSTDSYKGHPMEFEADALMLNMMTASPCNRIIFKRAQATMRLTELPPVTDGWALSNNPWRSDIVGYSPENEEGYREPIYGEPYIPEGTLIVWERAEPVRP